MTLTPFRIQLDVLRFSPPKRSEERREFTIKMKRVDAIACTFKIVDEVSTFEGEECSREMFHSNDSTFNATIIIGDVHLSSIVHASSCSSNASTGRTQV